MNVRSALEYVPYFRGRLFVVHVSARLLQAGELVDALLDADALPTWVNLFNNDQGKREYNILPLDYDRVEEWKTLFGISDNTFAAAEKSYNRTMGLVGEGLEECKAWLDQEKIDREQYYYDLAFFPEKFATEATEAVTEPAEETTAPAA